MSTASAATSASPRTGTWGALLLAGAGFSAARTFDLKDDIEIGREAPSPLAEEEPIGRVGNVVVKSLRVEVVGQVVTAHRQPHRVLRTDFEILGKPGIHRKKIGESAGIRRPHIILGRVDYAGRESAAELE